MPQLLRRLLPLPLLRVATADACRLTSPTPPWLFAGRRLLSVRLSVRLSRNTTCHSRPDSIGQTLEETVSRSVSAQARAEVDRARSLAERDERQRAGSPSAVKAAAQRADTLRRRGRLGRFLFENGLSIAAFAFFAVSFAGQIVAGHRAYNGELRAHGQPGVGLVPYLKSGNFIEATSENMESEFLQMGLFVLLTSFLYQRGSSESKTTEEPDAVDQDPREARDDPAAPWPVRHGGAWLSLYQRSLGIALLVLFLVAFVGHAIGGAMAYNEAERQHAGATVTALGYLLTSQFWFESFQNWQSEFFSVGVLVVLSIWLRQRGSAQSKPVAAPASDTGE
jgi:hypothetical protein